MKSDINSFGSGTSRNGAGNSGYNTDRLLDSRLIHERDLLSVLWIVSGAPGGSTVSSLPSCDIILVFGSFVVNFKFHFICQRRLNCRHTNP